MSVILHRIKYLESECVEQTREDCTEGTASLLGLSLAQRFETSKLSRFKVIFSQIPKSCRLVLLNARKWCPRATFGHFFGDTLWLSQ